MIAAAALAAVERLGRQLGRELGHDRLDHRRRCARPARRRRTRRPAAARSARLGREAGQVELQVLGVVGQRAFRASIDMVVLRERGREEARGRPGPSAASHSLSHAVQAAFRTSSPFCQLQGQSSSVCSASSTRSTSCGLRPTLRSLTETKRMTPSGSTMKVARSATPSCLSRMPSALRQLALDVGQHRERQVLQVGVVLRARPGARTRCRWRRRDLRVAVGELAVELAEGGDLGRADEGEVLGPEEDDLPLALVGLVVDLGEGGLGVGARRRP